MYTFAAKVCEKMSEHPEVLNCSGVVTVLCLPDAIKKASEGNGFGHLEMRH